MPYKYHTREEEILENVIYNKDMKEIEKPNNWTLVYSVKYFLAYEFTYYF